MPQKDPAARREYRRAYYAKNKQRLLEKAAQYRAEHPDKVAEAKRACYERYKLDPDWLLKRSEYQRERRENDIDNVKDIERRSREKRRDSIAAYQRLHSNTDARRARTAVNRAVRNGRLPSATTQKCKRCQLPAREYHHKSYKRDDWLNVEPVCAKCHKAIHAGEL